MDIYNCIKCILLRVKKDMSYKVEKIIKSFTYFAIRSTQATLHWTLPTYVLSKLISQKHQDEDNLVYEKIIREDKEVIQFASRHKELVIGVKEG